MARKGVGAGAGQGSGASVLQPMPLAPVVQAEGSAIINTTS